MNENWQKRILPFAVICIMLLIIIFFSFYLYQITQIQGSFSNLANYNNNSLQQVSVNNNQSMSQQLYNAEIISLLNRHHGASIIIKSRILIISLSFLTGVVMTFLGSIFILGKFNENVSTIEGNVKEMKVALASSSPGIILSTLGIILISISILSKTNLAVSDKPVYLNGYVNDINAQPIIDSTDVEELEELTLSPDNTDTLKRKP